MKKTTKKMQLNGETIRKLGEATLFMAHGAGFSTPREGGCTLSICNAPGEPAPICAPSGGNCMTKTCTIVCNGVTNLCTIA